MTTEQHIDNLHQVGNWLGNNGKMSYGCDAKDAADHMAALLARVKELEESRKAWRTFGSNFGDASLGRIWWRMDDAGDGAGIAIIGSECGIWEYYWSRTGTPTIKQFFLSVSDDYLATKFANNLAGITSQKGRGDAFEKVERTVAAVKRNLRQEQAAEAAARKGTQQ